MESKVYLKYCKRMTDAWQYVRSRDGSRTEFVRDSRALKQAKAVLENDRSVLGIIEEPILNR